MRGSKAKALRRRSKELQEDYIRTRVLTEEMYQEATTEQLKSILPERMLLLHNNRLVQAYGTKRFFNRAVKKRPDIQYKELDDALYNR